MMASPTLLETETIYGSRRGFTSSEVAELTHRLGIALHPFSAEHVMEVKLACARFGEGQGHPAQLNFGDWISYALAKVAGQLLAFKGEDFNLTSRFSN